MTTAQTTIDRARLTLLDPAPGDGWSDAELLAYLNMGIAQACGVFLDLYTTTTDHPLEVGVRQTLPDGALVLVGHPRNGLGKAVIRASVEEIERTHPDWASQADSADVRFLMYDRRSPRTFLVFPPASSGATVELVCGAVPDAIQIGHEIPISSAFDTALWAYVVGMALAKNSKRQDLAKSTQFLSTFSAQMERWQAQKNAAAQNLGARQA